MKSKTNDRLSVLERKTQKPEPLEIVYSIVERDQYGQLWCIRKLKRDKDTRELLEISTTRQPIDG